MNRGKGESFFLLVVLLMVIPGVVFSQGIIIDHTCTDITKIPDTWITQVKNQLKIHYAHTSHGEQITVGLERLSNSNSKYSYYPDNCTVPQTTQYLSLMDGQYMEGYCETYITPEYYWQGSYGLNITRSVLNGNDVNVSLWAWCTQLDYYSQGEAQDYLDAMAQLESEYPGISFVYMTGNAQSEEQNRYDRNQQIREYCQNNNKILFDFADLDCWYDGQQYTLNGIPMEHPHYNGDEAGHTTYASCENKANAFWWLLARIAGWDGSGSGGTGPDLDPFGSFDTPVDGSTVRSSIAVTGWALDDISVSSVKIYRQSGESLIYIGDASFVEGARPDVETAFPGYPNNSKAGWGYMLLTNFLPNNGNGMFTLYAVVTDSGGHQVTLGSKTITCDNAHAVKPFGAIDTPTQGGTASGSGYINWGWALTPQPNSIPIDGSTINVYVDSVEIGNPTYNLYRSDIATLFPDYANSQGAVGYFYLDTTQYDDGVHTIQWTVKDSDGNKDGVGSRYFTIQNSGSDSKTEPLAERRSSARNILNSKKVSQFTTFSANPIAVQKGYENENRLHALYPGQHNIFYVELNPMERLVLQLEDLGGVSKQTSLSTWTGFQVVGETAKRLPIGSTLQGRRGRFYWQPGPGFLGTFELVFIRKQGSQLTPVKIEVHISPFNR